MLDGPQFESMWGNGAESAEQKGAPDTEAVGDVAILWHLDHIRRTGRPVPDGAFTELTRRARELLFLEWNVLEPGRADAAHGSERPALSTSARLRSDEEVAWFREILDRLWQERYPCRADRRRAIVGAIQAEIQSLRAELGPGRSDDRERIEVVIAEHASTMRSRAGDRAADPDVDRSIRELTDKLRLLVHVDVLLATGSDRRDEVTSVHEVTTRDDAVRAAWYGCGYQPPALPPPGSDADMSDVVRPELVGRVPRHLLRLMLDPAGPVDERPLPVTLRDALRTPAEQSAVRCAVDSEVRRAAYPAGLADHAVRAHWFLAVLYADSRWAAPKLAAEVRRCAGSDPVAALRHLIRTDLPPHTLDRVRGAAMLQDGMAQVAADPDGWQAPVARLAFDGARSSRFAVPIEVARETFPLTTCGVRLPTYFGDDNWNRAQRFGESGLEQLCERAKAHYLRKVHQRLLKDDQLGTGTLRYSTPTQWHAITTKQMRRAAATTARQYRVARPLLDVEPPVPETDDDPGAAWPDEDARIDGPGRDVLDLLTAGPGAADVLAEVTSSWLESRHSRVGVAMNRRLAELKLFEQWWPSQPAHEDQSADHGAKPALRGTPFPLRQVLHRFVLTGRHRLGRFDPIDDSETADRADATRRAQQRASKDMFDAIVTMLVELKRYPRQGGRP